MTPRKGTTAAFLMFALVATASPAPVVGVAVGVAVGASACGPARCGKQCPADTEPTERQRQVCEDGVAPFPACQAEFTALRDCSAGLTVCGKDDRSDEAGTAQVLLKECSPQLTAYTSCTSRK